MVKRVNNIRDMIKHQTLKIKIPVGEIENYIGELYAQAGKMNYQRLSEIEKKLSEDNTLEYNYICLQTPRLHIENQYLTATLWLIIRPDVIELVNITSNQRSFLSTGEYNTILNIFYKDVILKVKFKGVRRILSKPAFELKSVMGEKCAEALIRFSNFANKDSGLNNDMDIRLWAEFIKLAYRTKARISAEELEQWLKENGWRDIYAQKLVSYYEYSLEILKYV